MRLEPFRAAGLFILGRGVLWLQLLGVAGDREKGGREEEGREETRAARACTGWALRSHCSARGRPATLHYQEHEKERSQARKNRKGKAYKDRQGTFPRGTVA